MCNELQVTWPNRWLNAPPPTQTQEWCNLCACYLYEDSSSRTNPLLEHHLGIRHRVMEHARAIVIGSRKRRAGGADAAAEHNDMIELSQTLADFARRKHRRDKKT